MLAVQGRLVLIGAALLTAGAGAADLRRAPELQWSTHGALAGVRLYQRAVSPLLARAGARCRLVPPCSHYTAAALARHGLPFGAWLAMRRVARCGPWTPAGTVDPPPPR